VTQRELEELGAQIILNNAFHLYLRPGVEIVKAAGGVHRFQNWKRPILTDSGGFQVFSLAKLRKINDEGRAFPIAGRWLEAFFTPESVIELEEGLGPDIAMVLDDVVANPARTIKQLWRCGAAWLGHSAPRSIVRATIRLCSVLFRAAL
jgi:queuine tRNA-ribosyltransferase